MASVRKRKYGDGTFRWVVDFKDDQGKRVLKTFDHKKSADAFRNNIIIEVQAGRFIRKSDVLSWQEAAHLYLDTCRKRAAMKDKMTFGTLLAYENDVARLSSIFGKLSLNEITRARVQDAVDELVKDYAPATVHKSIHAANLVFLQAIEVGRARVNPVDRRKLRLPPLEKRAKIPPKAALRAIVAAVAGERARYEPHNTAPLRKAIVMLALFMGLRRGEICGLRWGDIDWSRDTIRVQHSRSMTAGLKSTKTKAGLRALHIPAPVRAALAELLENRRGSFDGPADYVAVTLRGKPITPTSINGDHWRPVLVKAGLMMANRGETPPFRFHDLRNAAISLMIEQGVSLVHVKSMAGHSSIKTTVDVYGHLFPTDDAIQHASARISTELLATDTRLVIANH